MKWIRKKLIEFVFGDVMKYLDNKISGQIKNIVDDITKGNYRSYYDRNEHMVNRFNRTIQEIVDDRCAIDIAKKIHSVVENLEINNESFLDDIVRRLKKKQLK